MDERKLVVSRRAVLAAGAGAGLGSSLPAASTRPAGEPQIERVPLGKTGVKITRLGMGASFPEYGPRLLEFAYRQGIRHFDNGDFYAGYQAEARFGKWVQQRGRRDELFVVTKARTTDPKRFVDRLHQALEKMQLDTIDLFLVHSLDDPEVPRDRDRTWAKLKDRLIREKKIRFMGFSTHAPMPTRVACLNNAVKGGWVDALMVACDPPLLRSTPDLDRALDACAKANIGLLAMKTGRGLGNAANQPADAIARFKALNLTPHQAMLAAMWSDGRFSGTCSEMPNRKIIEENAAAARAFRKPFDDAQWKIFDEGARQLSRATCPGCDGSCQRAAGTSTDFCSIARYLAYAEEDGKRADARRLFAELTPEQRDWTGADLAAASRACRGGLDFENILERARRLLS